ncbi:MAG: YgjV family protein [Clostridia bacterium]|nr:YgjV family protein [Clostridia bacterium]
MTPAEIAGQVFSVLAMSLIILSFQPKRRSLYYIMQISGNVLFAVSFLLLGNVAGCLMNAMGVVRGLIMLALGQKRRVWALVLINALFVAGAVFAGTVGGDGWACLVSLAPQVIGTFSMWYGSDNAIRWIQLGLISPLWLVNNIFISLSIGGIICEVFCMVSASVYLARRYIEARSAKNPNKNAKGA